MADSIVAVVPVVDEVTAISDVVAGLLRSGACCVLVVDGGSRDGTREVARRAGAAVIHEPRRGYGRACLTGAVAAVSGVPHAHDAVAFLDGDGSCDPADLRTLADALSGADVVLGWRPARCAEHGAWPLHGRLGNALIVDVLRARTGRSIRDLSPFKLVRASTLRALDLDADGYGWTVQLVARALRQPGLRVRERPVRFRARRGGASKVSGSWGASLAAGRQMIRVALDETASRPTLALVAKAPGLGGAKTRLAAEIGREAADSIWRACLADIGSELRRAAKNQRLDRIFVVPSLADVEPVGQLLGPGWWPLVQGRSGLHGALTDGFLAAFDRGADRAVAVSADNPTLSAWQIRAAFDKLQHADAVLGPTLDGGYHLVGLRWRRPASVPRRRAEARSRLATRLERAFGMARMGTGQAFETTAAGLRAVGWDPQRLAAWPDLDTADDLGPLAETFGRPGVRAPRTRAWLAEHTNLLRPGEP